LFFAVKGLEHPPDRLIAVVRYAPDPKGQRNKEGISYRRLYYFAEQERLLQSFYTQYLAFDPQFQVMLQSVPISRIRRVYDPCVRLKELAEKPALEGIEADAVAFTGLIQREAGIPWSAVGVTGSILIGLHIDTSDLDISVFGSQNCRDAYEALGALRNVHSEVQRFDSNGIEELYRQRIPDTPMPFEEFARIERNKVCQRPYFIRFIKEAQEAAAKYGDVQYSALGQSTITATIVDDQEAIFTPCEYGVTDVRVVEGPPVSISEIVSFRGRFCEQARAGDSIRASGTVEQLKYTSGEIRYRLLLGNSSQDTMLVNGVGQTKNP
jgi:predicted nucleotidyltransferase